MTTSQESVRAYAEGWQCVVPPPTHSDLSFWIRQAKKYGSPVLELASGTGRISVALAKSGFSVSGLECSMPLHWEAKKTSMRQEVRVDWIRSDIRNFALGRKYSLIALPNNSLCNLLDLEELESCLACVKGHLLQDGKLIIDVLSPSMQFLSRNPGEKRRIMEYEDNNWKGTVAVSQSNHYDSVRQINTVKTFYQFPGRQEELVEESDMRLYFQRELEALLKYNGFSVDHKFGSFDEAPFGADSPQQLLVCSLAR